MSQVLASQRRALDRFMRWDSELPFEVVERMWCEPLQLLATGARLQHKPSCTVVRVDDPAGSWVFKHHVGGGLRRLRRAAMAPTPAKKAWIDGWFLHDAGIPTPRPRAYVERRVGPFKTSSYFLADYAPGRSLYRLLRYERPAEAVVRDLARQTAAIWQQLDDLAVCHNDFKTENLLVDPLGKVWLIDVDRMLRFRRREQLRERQARDVADLLHERNWRSNPAAAEAFRQEILQTPAGQEAVRAYRGVHPLCRPAAPDNAPAHLVTALIPCRNAGSSIRACLESVRDVADEILVADAGSTDDTLRQVRKFGGCRIIHGRAADNAAFETWAVRQAKHPWVLRILPDEQLNPELGRQVQDVAARDPAEDGFRIWRAIYFQGSRLKHGGFQHDSSVRLFRKEAARFKMRDSRVDAVLPGTSVGQLASRLIVEAAPSVEQRQDAVKRLADLSASGARGKKWPLAWDFFKSYVLRSGWLDGRAGFHAAWWSALTLALRDSAADCGSDVSIRFSRNRRSAPAATDQSGGQQRRSAA